MEVGVGSVEEVKMDKNKSPINVLECVPHILDKILSFLTFEQLDEIRLVNRRFCAASTYMLKKEFVRLKREVAQCQQKARFKMLNPKRLQFVNGKVFLFKIRNYTNQIFWFAVDQLLSNSFCYFDIRTGYLPQEYAVNGKTLDVVRFLLWFKDTEDPLLHFLETQIGRRHDDSNMKSYTMHIEAFDCWYAAKKHDRTDKSLDYHAKFVYRPVFSRKHPKLNLPQPPWHVGRFYYSMTVDLFSEVFTQNEANEKKHLVLFPRPSWASCQFAQAIQAIKPKQIEDEENFSDGSESGFEYPDFSDGQFSDDDF